MDWRANPWRRFLSENADVVAACPDLIIDLGEGYTSLAQECTALEESVSAVFDSSTVTTPS